MIELPNNRLILNWHRIGDINQLYSYLSKKFKKEINNFDDIWCLLSDYKNLKIAIRHAWSFLENEKKELHDEIIEILWRYWEIKQTWF